MEAIVFGESDNDRKSISYLLTAMSRNPFNKIRQIRQPIVLSRSTNIRKRRKMAQDISGFCSGLEKSGVNVVAIAHRDCDKCEPAHVASARELEQDLRAAGVKRYAVAAPAWEIETWLMLFPECFSALRPCWAKVNYDNIEVGLVENPKEKLKRDLVKQIKNSCPRFTESDVPLAFGQLSVLGIDPRERSNRCASLRYFFDSVDRSVS